MLHPGSPRATPPRFGECPFAGAVILGAHSLTDRLTFVRNTRYPPLLPILCHHPMNARQERGDVFAAHELPTSPMSK